MSDLDTLRPEVRAAVIGADKAFSHTGLFMEPYWRIIRSELLRLAAENAELHKAAARGALAHMKVEAELAALKARIAEAPIGMVMGGAEGNQDNTDSYRVDVPIGWESSLADRRVRLVVED